jgi:hypothetical protein
VEQAFKPKGVTDIQHVVGLDYLEKPKGYIKLY